MNKIFLLFFLLFPVALWAEDIYIAQTAQGGDTGADCANAHAAAWFNTAGNWGGGAGEIDPGDTAHVCGTITSALGFQASGTSGNEITLYFENNAKLSQANATPLFLSGNDYLIIDGGTNGIIENTDNGDALGNQTAASGISASGSADIEIKNLTIQNLYVKSGAGDTPDLTTVGAVYGNALGVNFLIHDCTFHDMAWIVNAQGTSGSGFQFYNNVMYNYDHGIAGLSGADNAKIYGNTFGTTSLWDTTSNQWHHDGIHIYFGATGSVTGVQIYNNLFDGNWGINNTAHIYLEGDYTQTNPDAMASFLIYNNVHIQEPGNMLNNGFLAGGGPNWGYYNNTYVGSGVTNSRCVALYGSGLSFKNNIVSGCTTFVFTGNTVTFAAGGLNNNLYANVKAGGNDPYSYQGTGYATLAAWKSATSQDGLSSQVADAGMDGDGYLQVGSDAIDNGADLSGLEVTALNSDKDGISRSGTWDIGAYEYDSPDIVAPVTIITTSDPSAISVNSLVIEHTSTDAFGVTSCRYRLGSAPDADNGTACAGTTQCSTTGYSSGANTMYVGCTDAAANWGTGDSIIVNYTPSGEGSTAVGRSRMRRW